MAADGIPSPDLWDTVCMAFLEGAHYMPAKGIAMAAQALRNLSKFVRLRRMLSRARKEP
jgi:hypothetical protein